MDAMKIANSPIMWVFAVLLVSMVVLQSVLLFRLARKFIDTTKILSKQEMRACYRSAGIATVGPAISVFILAIGMTSMLGSPLTLMRGGIIGSASTEMMAAAVGASALGVSLGTDALTGVALTAAVWTMAIMSSGYLIFYPFVARGLGKSLDKIMKPKEDGKRSVWGFLLGAVLPLAVFFLLAYGQVSQSWGHVAALVVSACLMLGLNLLAQKLDLNWLREWSMGFSVIGGILGGSIVGAL